MDKREAAEQYWENKYDLSSIDGIDSIPISATNDTPPSGDCGVTGKIEYYLHMKGGRYEQAGYLLLALACYKKCNEIMPHSFYSYERRMYDSYPQLLRRIRRFDEARIEEAKLDKLFNGSTRLIGGDDALIKIISQKTDELNTEFGNDLVISSYSFGCCSECAKLRNRVYSRFGKDSRYPILPEALNGRQTCCHIYVTAAVSSEPIMCDYIDGKQVRVDPIKFSNRPFIDDRTPEQIQAYNNIQEKAAKKAKHQRIWKRVTDDYNWIYEFLPDIAPKNVYAYDRAIEKQNDKFQLLVEEASKHGRTLYDYTKEPDYVPPEKPKRVPKAKDTATSHKAIEATVVEDNRVPNTYYSAKGEYQPPYIGKDWKWWVKMIFKSIGIAILIIIAILVLMIIVIPKT